MFVVALFALTLRVALVPPPPLSPRGDGAEYLELARSLARENRFAYADGRPTAFRAPLYPFALSLILRLFGESPRALHLFQAALGAAVAPLLFILSQSAGVLPRRAFIVAAGAALLGVPLCGEILTENLQIPLVTVALLASCAAVRSSAAVPSLLAGAAAGLCGLCRPAALTLLPAFLCAVRDRRRRIAFLASAALTLLPWSARNTLALGRPAGPDANLGYNLFVGHDPAVAAPPDFARSGARALALCPDLLHDDRPLLAAALHAIRADPARPLRLAPGKVARLFGAGLSELRLALAAGHPRAAAFAGWFSAYAPPAAVTLFFLAALPFGRLAHPLDRLLFAFLSFTVLLHAVFFGMPRFREPLLPAMTLFAARAYPQSAREGRGRHEAAAALAAAAVIVWALE